jgi:hypothetical protein
VGALVDFMAEGHKRDQPPGAADPVDREIAKLAICQHGNISRAQLLRLGLGTDVITRRCRTGMLYRVHQGVYAVGRPPKTPLERAAATVLACGPGAALCCQSAFTLWGFDKHWRFPLHVCSPAKRTRPGIVTHRFPSLAKKDVRTQLGIRVTSPARTILDHAPNLNRQQLRLAMAAARRSGSLKPAAIQDILDRNPTHPGHTPLLQAFKGYQPTRSELENTFLDFCARYDFPTPTINHPNGRHELDATFPGHNVIIELDGWDFHQDRHSFESDRDRDATHLANGTPTIRITWERITETPAKEAARLTHILAKF